jgi:hypothetical protein
LPWAGLLLLVFIGACRQPRTGSVTGARSSQEAVMQFLDAGRAQDLQAMSAVWGDDQALTREREDRQQLERRLLIIVCYLKHDESRIGAATPGEAGRVLHEATLTRGQQTATLPFTTVRNRNDGRWYVENVDLRPASGFCNTGGVPSASQRIL